MAFGVQCVGGKDKLNACKIYAVFDYLCPGNAEYSPEMGVGSNYIGVVSDSDFEAEVPEDGSSNQLFVCFKINIGNG